MNSFTFVAIALAFVVAVSAAPEKDLPHNDVFSVTRVCVPGKSFIDKCNRCGCDADGKGAACTKMACPEPVQPRIDGFSSEGLSCLPGKKFYDNCNSCTCSKTGKSAICTLAADCNVHARSRRSAEQDAAVGRPKIHIDNFSQSRQCIPGVAFYDKCNTCRCSADGKSAACTLMACSDETVLRIDNYDDTKKCPAGKTFKNKCNICNCGPDGVAAACTLMYCANY